MHKPVAGVSGRALARFAARARGELPLSGEVHVLVTGSREMRALNRRFRGRDRATDVLSFPALEEEGGDIAIAADLAAANAARLGHSVTSELKVLILHGLLHLAGYDHERDNGRMARRELKLRRALRLPLSLTERGAAPSRRRRR